MSPPSTAWARVLTVGCRTICRAAINKSEGHEALTGILGAGHPDLRPGRKWLWEREYGSPPPSSNRVFLVVEENHSYSEVIGNPGMPYLNSLATKYGLDTQYFANAHPSIGNYFVLTPDRIQTGDERFPGPISDDNIVRELVKSGKTWRTYAESLPNIGYTGGDVFPYEKGHHPFAYFSDVLSTTQANNIMPFSQLSARSTLQKRRKIRLPHLQVSSLPQLRVSRDLLWLREPSAALPDIAYAGLVLRCQVFCGLSLENRHLLHDLATLGAAVIEQWVKNKYGVRLLIMVVPHTFGGYLNFNCHLHILVSAGGLKESEGRWIAALWFNKQEIMEMWRDAVITYLRLALKALACITKL